MKSFILPGLLFSLMSFSIQAKVYKNIKVGTYKSVIDLNDFRGQPFFNVMKDEIYPKMNAEASKRTIGEHLDGIKKGEGVEVLLASDVTTYHVKYKSHDEEEVERSGRSFGVVGNGTTKKYIADASYKHYLTTLEAILTSDDRDVQEFFSAILRVIAESDSSEIALLKTESKQVAADFIAIYIAEQYRRLTATKGRSLGSSHQWDDALMQVTMLSAFHSGQDQMMMYYEGEFTDKVYEQNDCLYNAKDKEQERAKARKRSARLYDYWQFTVRSECPGRSGVNLTRKDFEKLGRALTSELNAQSNLISNEDLGSEYSKNFFKAATEDLLRGEIGQNAMRYTDTLVDIIMSSRAMARSISEYLSN